MSDPEPEQHMAREVDDFYAGRTPPLPIGVRPADDLERRAAELYEQYRHGTISFYLPPLPPWEELTEEAAVTYFALASIEQQTKD